MAEKKAKALLRRLPSVERVLQLEGVAALSERWDRELVADTVAAEIEVLRKDTVAGALDWRKE